MRKALAGTASAALLAAGCEYIIPQGVQVKQPADGVLAEDEERDIESALEAEGYVNDFTLFRPFVNDFNVFADNNFRAEGLPSVRFSDELHIYFSDNIDEDYPGNRPVAPAAFHNSLNSTAYFRKGHFEPLHFVSTFHHEAGHSLRDDAYEFPSQANKAYFLFNVYGFNRKAGSAFAQFAFNPPRPLHNPDYSVRAWCQPVNGYLEGSFYRNYGYGDLGFLVMANRFNGNLERAMDKILSAPQLWLEQITKNAGSPYGDMCHAMIGEFEKLLRSQGFQERLQRQMSREEVLEFIGYLQFFANSSIGYPLTREGLMQAEGWFAGIISEGEDFISRFGRNRYFRCMAVDGVSWAYIDGDAADIITRDALDTRDFLEFHRIAKKVIDMNRDYPCTFDIYECPKPLSGIREHHALAYLYATYFSNALITAGFETHASLIAVPEEYAQKFYASGNYHYEDNNRGIAVYTPRIAFFAGGLEEDMAKIAASYSDLAAMRQHLCKAVEWYNLVVEAGCSRVPDEAKRQECYSYVNVDETYVRQLISKHSSADCSDYQQ